MSFLDDKWRKLGEIYDEYQVSQFDLQNWMIRTRWYRYSFNLENHVVG